MSAARRTEARAPRQRRSLLRRAIDAYLVLLAFAVAVVLLFASIDRNNEGYKWLLAMALVGAGTFVAASAAAALSVASLARREDDRRGAVAVLLVSALLAYATAGVGIKVLGAVQGIAAARSPASAVTLRIAAVDPTFLPGRSLDPARRRAFDITVTLHNDSKRTFFARSDEIVLRAEPHGLAPMTRSVRIADAPPSVEPGKTLIVRLDIGELLLAACAAPHSDPTVYLFAHLEGADGERAVVLQSEPAVVTVYGP